MTAYVPPPGSLSWANPELRERLLTDPAAVLKDRGVTVPAELPGAIVHEFVRVAMLLWVDGKLTTVDDFRIDPADEGLLFGRGAWESTRTVDGVPWLWPLHLDRLRKTAELMRLNVTPNRLPTAEQVTEYVRGLTQQDVVVRLNVTAGRPGQPGAVWMSAAAQPYPVQSLRLGTCPTPIARGQSDLTLKTFQYATRLRIAQQAAQAGYDSALMIDGDGNLLEAAQANIFVRLPDGWATPTANSGFLPGTMRQHVLQNAPVPIREQVIPQTRIPEIHEAFVTSSNVGIVPVTQIDAHTLTVGADTHNLMRWLHPPAPAGVQYRFVDSGATLR